MFVWHMRIEIAKNNVTATSTTFKKHLFYKIGLYTGEIQCIKKKAVIIYTHKSKLSKALGMENVSKS